MQIGADIYCDSALMCRVIDRLAPEPPLYPAIDRRPGGDRRAVGRPRRSSGPRCRSRCSRPASPHVFAGAPPRPEGVRRRPCGDDRRPCGARRSPTQAAHLHDYLGRLERLLADDRPFLLGALPSIADFSAAQSIWFVRRAPPIAAHARRLPAHRRLVRARHGVRPRRRPTPMTSAEAIALARSATSHVRAVPRRCRRRLRRRRRRSASRRPTTRTTRSPAALVGLDAERGRRRARDDRAPARPCPFPARRVPRQGDQEGQSMKQFKAARPSSPAPARASASRPRASPRGAA